jgi:hypothetical protein
MLDATVAMGVELRTEFHFTLPRGFVDDVGTLHRDGVMRLATALDEIQPLRDPRVQANQAYVAVVLLSRVITRLGSIEHITPSVIERLFAADFLYLQELYVRLNTPDGSLAETVCPDCGSTLNVDLN